MIQKSILLVEDDISLRFAIESFLSEHVEYEVKSVGNVESARKELEKRDYGLVLSDIKMPGESGYDLLEHVKQNKRGTLVVLMAAYGTIEQVVAAMKNGAYDFIIKPFQLTTLENTIRAAFDDRDNMSISAAMAAPDDGDKGLNPAKVPNKNFITNNPKMRELIENLRKVAASKATVLVQGESGTGKEVLANMIHDFSPRRNKAFIAINCAAMPDNLLESELFGHEKGSFTGAIQRQIGKFELSDGGTILLDEISEMSLNMQTKLLRVLQECEVYRIGGSKPIPLNLRVIASTNRDLYKYMKDGNFREDLFYRINVIPIQVPPLRERGEDVVILAEAFLEEFAKTHDRAPLKLDELARYKILNYPWNGNVRELRNSMERAVLVGNFDRVVDETSTGQNTAAAVGSSGAEQSTFDVTSDITLDEMEKRVIYETLRRCKGNRTRTAEKLGISLRTLRNKLKAFRLEEDVVVEQNPNVSSQ